MNIIRLNWIEKHHQLDHCEVVQTELLCHNILLLLLFLSNRRGLSLSLPL